MTRTPTRTHSHLARTPAGRGPSWPWRLTLMGAMRASRRERGTVLLMVVGVLALLAIIGVVYATIGRGDRSMSTTVQRAARVDDQIAEGAQYLAGVIGDAVNAHYTEMASVTAAATVVRTRGNTYPWTNPYELSVNPADFVNTGISAPLVDPSGTTRAATFFAKFNPTGDNTTPWPTAGRTTVLDAREYGDSYLATLEPECERVGVGAFTSTNASLADMRDWRHISNFAPSGNFVNLANLRKTNGGGFNAQPGFRAGQMSYGLTLFDPTDAQRRPYDFTSTPSPNRPKLPGVTANVRVNPALPADFTNNQIGSFRPNVPDATTSSGRGISPADYEYLSNGYADADGDGFIDSRWFEMTDLSGLFNVLSPTSRSYAPARGRPRLVWAVRCVDNSAKINVNTAGDFKAGPFPGFDYGATITPAPNPGFTRELVSPPGISPADIDLSRLLGMYDIATTLRQAGATNIGYDGLPQPSTSDPSRTEINYSKYKAGVAPNIATGIGDVAYANLHDALMRGATSQPGAPNLPLYQPYGPERQRTYDLFGANRNSTRGVLTPGGVLRGVTSPLDMSDELDLIAFFGVNDSDTLSRLEAAVDGRSTTVQNLGPLRDNRPRSLEMRYRDEFAGNLFQSVNLANVNPQSSALLSVFSDVRHLLTTVSGSRPIKDSSIAPNDFDPVLLPGTELQGASTDITYALRVIQAFAQNTPLTPTQIPQNSDYAKAVRLIFKLYANALMPYTNSAEYTGVWNAAPTTANRQYTMGLVYGGNPEAALEIAAHMTANLIDAYHRSRPMSATGRPTTTDRNEPTVLNLGMVATDGTGTTMLTPGQDTGRAYLGGVNLGNPFATQLPFNLPIASARLATSTLNLTESQRNPNLRGRKIIFGVEPQPFLTEIHTFALYTDAPEAAGGDKDYRPDTGPGGGGELMAPTGTDGKVSIKASPDLNNSDFIGEVIAFQLNNPFDQDVVLFDASQAGSRIDSVKYYIEYSGRYYCFATGPDSVPAGSPMPFGDTGTTIKLLAGETRVFYVMNPGTPEEMGNRIQRIDAAHRLLDRITPAVTDFTAAAKNFISSQLKGSSTQLPLLMTQVFPTTLNAVPGMPSNNAHEMDIWDTSLIPVNGTGTEHLDIDVMGDRRVVQLWRVMRSDATLETSRSALDSTNTENDPSNDLLADRLRDPSTSQDGLLSDTRKKFDTGSAAGIDGTDGGVNDTGSDSEVADNTGYSVIVWAAVRRPSDKTSSLGLNGAPDTTGGTLDSSSKPIRGVLPPWCMEARSDNPNLPGGSSSLNMAEGFTGATLGDKTAFTGKQDHARATKLGDLLNIGSPVNDQIAKPCYQKTKNQIGKNLEHTISGGGTAGLDYSQVAVEFHSVGEDMSGGGSVFRSRNPALFSRAGDFLLPLAVGPSFDPSRSPFSTNWPTGSQSGTAAKLSERESQWMTLSESLALACGYYNPSDPGDSLHNFGIAWPATEPGPQRPPMVDRGHLVLDAFIPYFVPPSSPTSQHQPLGSGAPFALSIIDQFRTATGISSSMVLANLSDPTSGRPEAMTRDFAYGGGTTILDIPQDWTFLTTRNGLVNLNTAPSNVIRTLPMIAPVEDPSAWWSSPAAFDLQQTSTLKLYDTTDATRNYDIAPTLKACRDLSIEEFRALPGSVTSPGKADFATHTRSSLLDPVYVTGAPAQQWRETHGFKSLGEVASVSVVSDRTRYPRLDDRNGMSRFAQTKPIIPPSPGGTAQVQESSIWPLNPSRFYNHDASGKVDTTTAVTPPNSGGPINLMGGPQLDYSYQDKLTVINALTNTASVRSDIFTVYFLVHGYTAEDVDIDDSQPLVPSIAKRYVMVVDRSNVVAKGDKPRILMLKEVPIP